MGKPKKRTTARRTGTRRSHLVLKLARAVNRTSPIKAFTTRREAGKKLSETRQFTKLESSNLGKNLTIYERKYSP